MTVGGPPAPDTGESDVDAGDPTVATRFSRLPMSLKLSAQLLLTVLVTWFILEAVGVSLDEIRRFDTGTLDFHWGLLLLSCLILLVAYLYGGTLWGFMVREIGGHEVGVIPSLRVLFTANLGRYIPGKLWQIAGLVYLAKAEGVPAGTATGTAVLGHAFSLAGATLVGAGVLLGMGKGPNMGGGWAALVVLALVLAATSPSLLKVLVRLWFRLAKSEVPESFRPDRAFGLRWTGLYALAWALQGLGFWVLAWGLGFQLPVLLAASAYPAAYVTGYLALFSPAGAGIREGMLVVFLGPALGAGALVLALTARLWTTLVELAPALFLASGYLGWKKGGIEKGV